MLINVIEKKINYEALGDAISIMEADSKHLYLIMNEDTFKEIIGMTIKGLYCHSYFGNPIAICNELEFGQIEVR